MGASVRVFGYRKMAERNEKKPKKGEATASIGAETRFSAFVASWLCVRTNMSVSADAQTNPIPQRTPGALSLDPQIGFVSHDRSDRRSRQPVRPCPLPFAARPAIGFVCPGSLACLICHNRLSAKRLLSLPSCPELASFRKNSLRPSVKSEPPASSA